MPLRYIDPHAHITELGWDDLELMGIGGLDAAVCPMPRPDIVLKSRGEAFDLGQVRAAWDHALWYGDRIAKTFFYQVYHALSLGSNSKIQQFDLLLGVMEEYLEREDVVAVGELGLDPYQWTTTVSEAESAEILRHQFEIAAAHALPVILHTPMVKSTRHYIEGPRLPPGAPPPLKVEFARRTLALAREAGLPDEQIVIDHADGPLLEYVFRETRCWAGISGANRWRSITPEQAAQWVVHFGHDRILINSDAHRHFSMDPLWVPRVLRELQRLSVSPVQIHQVAVENPARFFGLPRPAVSRRVEEVES